MRTTKRITEITIEKSECLIVHKPRELSFAWCVECDAEVQMLQPEEAARIACVSTRTIYCWIEAGMIHFNEADKNNLLVCCNSLSRQ